VKSTALKKLPKRALIRLASTLGLVVVPQDRWRTQQQALANLWQEFKAYYKQHTGEAITEVTPHEIQLLTGLIGTNIGQGIFILDALRNTSDLPGAVCEFGVAQGATSALIAHAILPSSQRQLCLFDSFEGLPAPTDEDELIDDIFGLGTMDAYAGRMAFPKNIVLSRLNQLSFPSERLVVFEGYFDQVLAAQRDRLPARVSFAYVDFDFYEPICQVLDYLHLAISPGGVIVIDDYDFFSSGAKLAVDEFLARGDIDAGTYTLEIHTAPVGHFAVIQKRRSARKSNGQAG